MMYGRSQCLAAALVLAASASAARAGSFAVAGPPQNDVDTNPATTVSLTVPSGPGNITDVNVRVEIDETFSNEVEVSITHGSVTVRLMGPTGVGGDGYDYTFDDEASTTPPLSPPPGFQTGTFQPRGPGVLSDFDGIDSAGTWTLSIVDPGPFPGDGTRLLSWVVFGTTSGAGVVTPEPGTWALFGLGVLGLGAFAMSRRRARLAPALARRR